jgi:predicted small lipoprotein YifL
MKNAITTGIMAATILIAGCGKKPPSSSAAPPPAQASATSSSPVAQPPERAIATNAFPQFTIAPGDLASPARVTTNKDGSTVVHIILSDSKREDYHKFGQDHQNQQIEIVAGSKVLMRLMVHKGLSGGGFGVDFASTDTNAQALADWLNKQ